MGNEPLKTGARIKIDFGRMPGPQAITIDGKETEECGFLVDDIRIGWPSATTRLPEIRIHGCLWPPKNEDGLFVQQGAFVAEEDIEEFLAWRATKRREGR